MSKSLQEQGNKKKILVVDDEKDIRELITDIIEDDGYSVIAVKSGNEAIDAINSHNFSAAVLDVWLEGSDIEGIGVLEYLQKNHPNIPAIMISGHANISLDNKKEKNRHDITLLAIQKGAYDFIEKPFSADKLLTTLRRAIEVFFLKKENSNLKVKAESNEIIIGSSASISYIKNTINKFAKSSSRIFLSGPPGSGKRLIAQTIHDKSDRANFPMVVFHPNNLQFSTPSAIYNIISQANNSTIFIDDVADLSNEIQSWMLQILQTSRSDARIISSTSKNIEELIDQGKFSQGLYHRLNVIPIKVPPLIERKDDIPELADYFLKSFYMKSGFPYKKFSEDAIATLQLFDWPGNIRQLKNVIEWSLIITSEEKDNIINASMLPHDVISKKAAIPRPDNNAYLMSMPLREAREVFEAQYLAAQLERFKGNISKTALFIGMERSALHRKLKALNIINEFSESNDNNSDIHKDNIVIIK